MESRSGGDASSWCCVCMFVHWWTSGNYSSIINLFAMHHFTDSKQRIWQGINRGKIGETENGGNRHCFFLWCLPAILYSHQFIMFSFLYGPTKQTNGNQSDLRMLVLYICQAWRWFTGGLIIWVNYNLIVRFWQCTRHYFFNGSVIIWSFIVALTVIVLIWSGDICYVQKISICD